jgi:hypothetical protein
VNIRFLSLIFILSLNVRFLYKYPLLGLNIRFLCEYSLSQFEHSLYFVTFAILGTFASSVNFRF